MHVATTAGCQLLQLLLAVHAHIPVGCTALATGAQPPFHPVACIDRLLQIGAYAGLDIVAKVVFGWIIMLLGYPMIGKQMNMEHEQ